MNIILIQFIGAGFIAESLAYIVGELARKKCEQYSKYVNDKPIFPFGHEKYGVAQCDPIVMPLIVGGLKADRTEFPHMAAIGYGNPSEIEYLCGGSLISEKFIMTAAHCAKDSLKGRARAARLGAISLVGKDDHTHVVAIGQIHSHPDYSSRSKYNDIALMQLIGRIYFNEFIRPACINVNNHIEWSKAIATGFGYTSHELSFCSNDLLKVELDKMPLELCRKTYRPNRELTHGLIESQLCAGDLVGNKDTCQGDSGGPLQILLAKPHCIYSIIGITSYGKACGFENVPAIYTNVANYTSWIEEVVWKRT